MCMCGRDLAQFWMEPALLRQDLAKSAEGANLASVSRLIAKPKDAGLGPGFSPTAQAVKNC